MRLLNRIQLSNRFSRPSEKPYISAPVLILIGISAIVFLVYQILKLSGPNGAGLMAAHFMMPTNLDAFINRPWTLFSSLFFHQSGFHFFFNTISLLVFGNLSSMLLSKRIIIPMFVSGGILAAIAVLVFKELPLFEAYLQNQFLYGSSGGMMTLAILATFYMPEQMVRLYGIFPLKLKFIGRFMLLVSVVGIIFNAALPLNLLQLGGALSGYLFLVLLRRNKIQTIKLPFFHAGKKVKPSAKVEMKIAHNKPLTDEEYNTVRVSQHEYLDYLLDKIGSKGMDSLSQSELEFLNRFGKE